jgi:membrane protein
VTFYLLLALFPALAAFVSLYGFVADPATVADHVSHLGGLLPSAGVEIIRQQLVSLASQDEQALGIGFLTGLAIALWSAHNGVMALFDAMNIAHEEDEKRGFVKLNLMSIAFTMGALLIGIGLILTVGAVPAMLAYLRLDAWAETLIAVGRWPVLLVAILTGISLIYRFGPSRRAPKWRWLSWGAAIATVVWVGASWAFSFYLQNFADYNATYGSLGAVIGLMMWTWISVIILIVGAEINAEMEHQTKCDSTVGEPKPMGERGAVVADTLGKTAEEM